MGTFRALRSHVEQQLEASLVQKCSEELKNNFAQTNTVSFASLQLFLPPFFFAVSWACSVLCLFFFVAVASNNLLGPWVFFYVGGIASRF